ncbi:hypothetical protein HT031_002298 [Scenedesmus sp. PABB004]|nr:hypothetical protein HT031_002298 [Scenedesmus sp. PABB004]
MLLARAGPTAGGLCTAQRTRAAAALAWPQLQRHRRRAIARASGDADTAAGASPSAPAAAPSRGGRGGPAAVNDAILEQVFYEGSASNAELLISLLLGATLVYLPITIAIIGKRLWFTYRFTNKRVTIINTSPLFARTTEVAYRNIAEVRTAPRAFGLWGDCVIFLKDGSRLELTGLERYKDIERHIASCIIDD